jgi:ADP-L-glycero-D-manno-heptose 6-epimerase
MATACKASTARTTDSLKALRPLNAYGWSKALFDIYAVREAARPGFAPSGWA